MLQTLRKVIQSTLLQVPRGHRFQLYNPEEFVFGPNIFLDLAVTPLAALAASMLALISALILSATSFTFVLKLVV
jgi:hypothetical protein